MTFSTTHTVRFGDEDHARVVYYPRIFDYIHIAFEDFFNAQGIAFRDMFEVDKIGFPLGRAECDFSSPFRLGDEVAIDVDVLRIGQRSATFGYTLRRRGAAEISTHAKMTVVCVRIDTFESSPIPQKYRDLFARHLVSTASG